MFLEGSPSVQHNDPHLEVRGLACGYRSKRVGWDIFNPVPPPIRWSFRDLNLDLDSGTMTILVGQNGSGKTSLLRALGSGGKSCGELRVKGDVTLRGERSDLELLDEPFQGLDSGTKRAHVDGLGFIKEKRNKGILISATHYFPTVLTQIVDHVLFLGGGKTKFGTMDQMRDHEYVDTLIRASDRD